MRVTDSFWIIHPGSEFFLVGHSHEIDQWYVKKLTSSCAPEQMFKSANIYTVSKYGKNISQATAKEILNQALGEAGPQPSRNPLKRLFNITEI